MMLPAYDPKSSLQCIGVLYISYFVKSPSLILKAEEDQEELKVR